MVKKQPFVIRQGDVLLTQVTGLPVGCTEVPLDNGRIILAYGEVTGHAHAIRVKAEDTAISAEAVRIASGAISRAKASAKLYATPQGERYLVVDAPVMLSHEEHTAHEIPPGIYLVPVQVEYKPEFIRQVAD